MAARATGKDIAQHPKKNQAPARDLEDPSLYVNRELGLLAFQWRVLEEAQDETNPLLERVKFLAIRRLQPERVLHGPGGQPRMRRWRPASPKFGPDRMSPSAQLVAIRREVKRLLEAAHQCLEQELRPALAEEGIHVVPDYAELSSSAVAGVQAATLTRSSFRCSRRWRSIPGRPFPHISNLSLNLAVLIRDAGGRRAVRARQSAGFAAALVPLTRMHRPPRQAQRARGARNPTCGSKR